METDLQKTCTRLYNLNREDLYAFIVRNMRDETASLDMLQDIFLNFYKFHKKNKLPPNDTECRMYLFRMARNLMINFSKTAYNRKVDLVDDYNAVQSTTQNMSASVENDVLKNIDMQNAEELLQKLLANLDEKYRNVILLRYNAGLKLEEIASIMETTVSTISRQIKKAERLLQQKAREAGFEFQPEE